ncbi:hypothetical protein [Massilia rubra]|uniref:Uncharacterized protein n=1 Tax=Massilia rubra TaxID=2607910 RepID=A0ABX0LN74_9BURK|nr:hypothetical protein [Massilia rubra]NHZ34255.1 hypothetical protein [Massilia rubra]
MKVRKNLEAVFLAATVMVTFAAYATADVPVRATAAPAHAAAVADSTMTVVVVSAKRLSAAEKAAQQ